MFNPFLQIFFSIFLISPFSCSDTHWNFERVSFQTMDVHKSAITYFIFIELWNLVCRAVNVLYIWNFPLLHKWRFAFWDTFLSLMFLPVIMQIYHNCRFLKIFAFLLLGKSLLSESLQQLQTVQASEVTFHFSALALTDLDLLSMLNSPRYWKMGRKIITCKFYVGTRKFL